MKTLSILFRHALLLGLLLGPARSLFSQQPAAAGRSFHLTSIGVRSRDFRYLSPQTRRPYYLDVSPALIAGPYQFDSSTLPIFKLEADGTRSPAAIAEIPRSILSPLIVIVPGPVPGPNETTLPYGTIVLDYSIEQVPANSIRFLNVSRVQVAVAFGKSAPFTLSPGGQNVVSYTPPSPDNCYVPMKLAFTRNGAHWHRIPVGEPTDDIALDKDLRVLVILNPDSTKPDGGASSAFTVITSLVPPSPSP